VLRESIRAVYVGRGAAAAALLRRRGRWSDGHRIHRRTQRRESVRDFASKTCLTSSVPGTGCSASLPGCGSLRVDHAGGGGRHSAVELRCEALGLRVEESAKAQHSHPPSHEAPPHASRRRVPKYSGRRASGTQLALLIISYRVKEVRPGEAILDNGEVLPFGLMVWR
jgi:hypothetical protein